MIAAEALRLSLRQQQSAESKSAICRRAFDLGITHFDFANNNEPPPQFARSRPSSRRRCL